MWKKTTPASFKSPFYAQGDIGKFPPPPSPPPHPPLPLFFWLIFRFFSGFFSHNNKKFGAFFCAVQTFNGYLFAIPIKNLKVDTLFKAVEAMSKVLPPPSPTLLFVNGMGNAGARISKDKNPTV